MQPGDILALSTNQLLIAERPATGEEPVDHSGGPWPVIELLDLTIPSSCALNNPITLDASRSYGSLSRPWTATEWSASACTGAADCTKLNNVLGDATDEKVQLDLSAGGFTAGMPLLLHTAFHGSLPRHALPSVTASRVHAYSCNSWQGALVLSLSPLALRTTSWPVAKALRIISVINADQTLSVDILSWERNQRSSPIELTAVANTFACNGATPSSMTYSWSSQPPIDFSGIPSAKSASLYIPANTLDLTTYQFTVQVTATFGSNTLTASSTQTIIISSTHPTALVTVSPNDQPSNQGLPSFITTMQSGSSIYLDASGSFCADCAVNTGSIPYCNSPPTFSWHCCATLDPESPAVGACAAGFACPDSINDALKSAKGSVVQVNLPASLPKESYLTFSVTASFGDSLHSFPAHVTGIIRSHNTFSLAPVASGLVLSNENTGISIEDGTGVSLSAVGAATKGKVKYGWNFLSPPGLSKNPSAYVTSDLNTGM